jgi:uncharacterized OsmC-like protein
MPAAIREALERLRAQIAAQPERARAKPGPTTARMVDGLRCEVRGPNGEAVRTDMAPAMGGGASAPAPGWLMRASLASCTATCIAMRAATQGIELTQLEVTVESEADQRGMLGMDEHIPAGPSAFVARVRIGAAGVPANELRALAEWADRHSPVASTARASPRYSLEVEVA